MCVSVCMCVLVCTNQTVCVCSCAHAWVGGCNSACMCIQYIYVQYMHKQVHTYVHTHIHTYAYIRTYTYKNSHACTHTNTQVITYKNTCTHTHTHKHAHTQLHGLLCNVFIDNLTFTYIVLLFCYSHLMVTKTIKSVTEPESNGVTVNCGQCF